MVDLSESVKSPDTEAFKAAIDVQAAAAIPARSAFVSANAGSGKTKVLIDRVARLLLRREDGRPGAKPDSILCITYTKAAANEMLSRLFKTLGRWSVMPDGDLKTELSRLEHRKTTDYTEGDLKAARALFAQALETPGGLRIETIHAFCSRVLRRFPLEAGVFPGFSEIEEAEADELWTEARREAITRARADDAEALDLLALESPHLGAISGLDILRRHQAVALGFAEDCAFSSAEMARVLRETLNAPEARPAEIISQAIGEALPADALRAILPQLLEGAKTDKATAEQLEVVLSAAPDATRWQAYLRVFNTASGAPRTGNPYTAGAAKKDPAIAALFQIKEGEGSETRRIRQVEQDVIRAQALARTSALLRVGVPALQAYRDKKAKRAVLDFDDLIERTRELLSGRGVSDWVLYKLDGGISHVLLDEAQDTSPSQWQLIKALTEEFSAGEGAERQQDPRTLFVVGDEKQSIYSFQGAAPELFRETAQEMTHSRPDFHVETMRMSFRSSPEILNFVDAVWNNAPAIERPIDATPPASAEVIEHVARRSNQPGTVALWPVLPKQEEADTDAWERPVNVLSATSPKAELAKRIACEIRAKIYSGESVWAEQADRSWRRRRARPEDFLILVRGRTGGLFDAMITALKAAGLPVAGADRLKLMDHLGVQDCLNLLRFAVMPERDLVLAEILRGPFCGLIDDDACLYPLAAGRGRDESLWDRVQQSADPVVQRAAVFLTGLIEHRNLPPFDFLSRVLDEPATTGETGWHMLNARLGTPVRDPVEALLDQALGYDSGAAASLEGFVSHMERHPVEIKRDLAASGGEVRVMTVHGAKGLQAPIVILPDTTARPKTGAPAIFDVEGVPVWSASKKVDLDETAKARALAVARDEEEFRRLLYVALTRAQDQLIIAGYWFGAADPGYDSRSWYALCANAMDQLGCEPDDEGVRRLGHVAQNLPETAQGEAGAGSLPDWIDRRPPDEWRSKTYIAPSKLLESRAAARAPFSDVREARLRRGRIIHSLLQYLPEITLTRREEAAKGYLSRYGALSTVEVDDILQVTFALLADPQMAEVFAPGGRAEAAIIGTAPELPDGQVINGRVDRLMVSPERVLVIDFKTDQPAPDAVDQVEPGYIVQMAAYWAVLRQMYPGRGVKAAICWTDGPKLMALPEEKLLASLNRLRREV